MIRLAPKWTVSIKWYLYVFKITVTYCICVGIGYETALEFAKRGCRVIMACRNQEKANAAREKIVQATGNENVVVKSINLDTLSSVRAFAKDINENEDRLDLLVNNAGAAYLPDQTTEDGLQLEMACNYFSPFLLTVLLLGTFLCFSNDQRQF